LLERRLLLLLLLWHVVQVWHADREAIRTSSFAASLDNVIQQRPVGWHEMWWLDQRLDR
jgi:hypothetical protein